MAARRNERMGITCSPEPDDARVPGFAFNLRVPSWDSWKTVGDGSSDD
jgi:hypothetical protein